MHPVCRSESRSAMRFVHFISLALIGLLLAVLIRLPASGGEHPIATASRQASPAR